MDKTIYYPYNSFGHYYGDGIPMVGKRAHEFVKKMNLCKGGTWTLHTKEQYEDWHERVGQHKDFLNYRLRFPLLDRGVDLDKI